jgi:chromosome segregation ATPase
MKVILRQLDAMTNSESEAGKFASAVAQQLRSMEDRITNANEIRLRLENQLHEAQHELAEKRIESARRKGEIERQLGINRQYREKLLEKTPKATLRIRLAKWKSVITYLATIVPDRYVDAGLYTIEDVAEWCSTKLKDGGLTQEEQKNVERVA